MKISLAAMNFINGDTNSNFNTIIETLKNCQKDNIDFVFFGEAFLQGFDAFNWNYDNDIKIAISTKDEMVDKIKEVTLKLNIGIGFGYLEVEKDYLYSSYLVIDKGIIINNYRRISKGWKEYKLTNEYYKEGIDVKRFKLRNKWFAIALCGDLWNDLDRFKLDIDFLIWPVYLNYSIAEWQIEKYQYACQAQKSTNRIFMINSTSSEPCSFGGAIYFENGKINKELEMGYSGCLNIEVD